MIKFIDRYFSAPDQRGVIEGLINFGTWEELNYIRSDKGIIRGNHYHKHTLEAFIILSGKLKISLQKVINGQLDGEIEDYIVEKRQVFLINPLTLHVFNILEDSEWINVLSKRMDQNNPDIYRL